MVAYIIDWFVVGTIRGFALLIIGGFLLLMIPLSITDLMGAGGNPEAALGSLTESLGLIFAIRLYLSLVILQILLLSPLWAGWLYYALLESSEYSATVGKMAMGIVVADRYGRRVTFERATARYFSKIITGFTFGVGYLMAAFSSRKQALHDIIAGCLLIYRGPADEYEDDAE